MGSEKQIDDLIESSTVRLLDLNDAMTDIQLGMSDSNYCSWYIRIKKKSIHDRWEITRFTKEHTCLVQVHQNKHRNMTSKFIAKLISHLVANDPEILVSNVIQEVQILLQTGCTYKRA
ncbi:hypothetical protein M9H77_07336 [Catharanthus roseus]|uniref:Uncharacterized protein n=1 Tax=Catharanthus roseus TaxID=4058 RepID=A0ACC0BUQ8_CATRO|nr:hypothetical protein M9H77_07336 [Catharanthus roseus]